MDVGMITLICHLLLLINELSRELPITLSQSFN